MARCAAELPLTMMSPRRWREVRTILCEHAGARLTNADASRQHRIVVGATSCARSRRDRSPHIGAEGRSGNATSLGRFGCAKVFSRESDAYRCQDCLVPGRICRQPKLCLVFFDSLAILAPAVDP